jgi:uncharacterized protein YaeQ
MALKSTIFKADLKVADLDRNVYADFPLTLAQHPSETEERLMVRILAYALFAHERLAFGPGISDADEPDLWQRDLTGAIERWIEVGLPDEKRLARACGRADEVVVLAYGRAVDIWWKQIESKLNRLPKLQVLQLDTDATKSLSEMAARNMALAATIQEGQALVSSGDHSVTLDVHVLKTLETAR